VRKSIESVSSRAISIVSKFFLLTFLAKVMSLSDYGTYQLIMYFMMISVYIYGLEYYMIGNREVAKGDDNVLNINNHLSFFFTLFPFTFLVQLLALFYLIPNDVLTLQIVIFIIVINFCEYFNQEIYRYLVMIQRINKANLLLIIKSLAFLVLVLAYYYYNKNLMLDEVISILFISYILLLLITTFFFFKYVLGKKEVDIRYLRLKELKPILLMLLPFFWLMIFTKGISFFDKFAIDYYYDTEEVGIYSFLFSIASLIYIFITSGFYIIYLPELIKMHNKNSQGIKQKLYKYSLLVMGFSVALILIIIFGIEILLKIIGKDDLINNIGILYPLLGAFFFLNLSTIPTMLLYIVKKDKELMWISGVVFILNVILNIVLLQHYYIYGAALALVISYSINFILALYKAKSVWKEIV